MARCGATETCPDGAYLNGLCKFHNDCKHYAEAIGRDFQPERFGRLREQTHKRRQRSRVKYERGVPWSFYLRSDTDEQVPPRPRQWCERCEGLNPTAWHALGAPIPETEPWRYFWRVCESCAEQIQVERAYLHHCIKRVKPCPRWNSPKEVDRCRHEACKEYAALVDQFRCIVCLKRKPLKNIWQCDACYRDWKKHGRPQGLDWRIWVRRRREESEYGAWEKAFSLVESVADLREYRATLYNGINRNKALFDLDASRLPWRDRLQTFRHEVPMSALPVEVTLNGSPSQIAAAVRELVAAVAAAPAESPAAQFAPASGSPPPAPSRASYHDKQKRPTLERRAPAHPHYLTSTRDIEGNVNSIRVISDWSMVAKIAELDPGWHSGANAAWKIAGESYEDRSEVKTCLGELHRAGEVERLYVLHNDQPLPCYKIDPPRLQALLAEHER